MDMWVLSTSEPLKAVTLGIFWYLAYVQLSFAAFEGVQEFRGVNDLFTFPAAGHNGSYFSTSTPTLVILGFFVFFGAEA